jgi:DNA-binding NarL/FixJ family response regulator
VAITVSIVDDSASLRAEFARLITQAEGLSCVSQYPDAESALAHLAADQPDVVLMDINMPGMTGVECVRRLKAASPAIQVVMLTVFDNNESIFESLKAGASGYLLKRAAADEIIDAIHLVQAGGAPMSISVARKVVQFFNQRPQTTPELDSLTAREREVLEKISAGLSYSEIGDSLSITVNTVRKHIRSIYEKLHVNSRTEAAMKFMGS